MRSTSIRRRRPMQSIGQVVGSNPVKSDSNRAVVNGVPGARQSREAARPQAGNPVSRTRKGTSERMSLVRCRAFGAALSAALKLFGGGAAPTLKTSPKVFSQAVNPVSRPKNRRPGWGVCFWVCARFLAREFKRASTRRSVSRSAEHEKTFGRPAAESSFCLFVPKRVFTSLRGKRMRL